MIHRLIQVLALTLALVGMVGCLARTASRSSLSTQVGGREVQVNLDGNGFISSQEDSAVVTFQGGKLLIAKNKIDHNGKEIAKVPEAAKKVVVDYIQGRLTITADGVEILAQDLKK